MNKEMIISVKFKSSIKCYYFSSTDRSIKIGDFVLVETTIGLEIAEVIETRIQLDEDFTIEIKPILRKADENDFRIYENILKCSEEAKDIFLKLTLKLNLNMKLIDALYTFDKTKILFIYSSDDRVDFRELLKLLAKELHCRIELKQINARERAQIVGGIGVCGLPLCCTTFLKSFDKISLNKAKNQMLAINIPKLSGQCGTLLCCLKYEDDIYTEEKKKFPPIGSKVFYENEEYKLTSFNILSKIVKIEAQDKILFVPLKEIKTFNDNHGKHKK